MKKYSVITWVLLFVMVLAACGNAPEEPIPAVETNVLITEAAAPEGVVADEAVISTGEQATAVPAAENEPETAVQPETVIAALSEDYPDALPIRTQLMVGTLKLEGGDQAVTPEQAAELLVLWQASRTLSRSGTGATEEVTAVLNQIEAAMTPEQIAAIAAMQLTRADIQSMSQAMGLSTGSGDGAGPEGSRGQGQNLSPEEQATRQAERAERTNTGASEALLDALIQILEERKQ
jgi:hypothetical protein